MTEELLAYKRMPLWTAETMPEAVKRKHNTKEGTWGKITVLKGRLKFVEMSEEGEELAEHIFEAGLRIISLRNTAAIQFTQRFWRLCKQSGQSGP